MNGAQWRRLRRDDTGKQIATCIIPSRAKVTHVHAVYSPFRRAELVLIEAVQDGLHAGLAALPHLHGAAGRETRLWIASVHFLHDQSWPLSLHVRVAPFICAKKTCLGHKLPSFTRQVSVRRDVITGSGFPRERWKYLFRYNVWQLEEKTSDDPDPRQVCQNSPSTTRQRRRGDRT
ncbi:hypothetical protein E2C01_047166 [Portunus trituberculatus]|uniref:Uncharacterized protein n=1 Tax=Portunus trituberculatus TaxID=210409 RepID=A0A5B7G6T9_PORTR|nr:hypothetical protein [Portunus trituberculatus]